MAILLSLKFVEISLLKAKLVQNQIVGPGSAEVIEFKAQNISLFAQVEELKDKLLNHHMELNACLTLIVKFLRQKPPSPPSF